MVITKNKFEEKEYFKFPISNDIMNGLVKINVSAIIKNNNCIKVLSSSIENINSEFDTKL